MMVLKTFSLRLKSLRLVSVGAMGLLTACGKHGSSEAPLSSVAEKGTQAGPVARCFYAAGRLSKNDAELFAASGAGDVRRAEKSVDAGGNVNATDSLKRTPLFAAAFCNHAGVAHLLIDKGSDVNARDFIGMSPLHAAVIGGGDEAAKELLSRGANIDIPSTVGQTPLHLAAATNQVAMVELLLERGANARVRDKDGITAASLATKNGHPAVAATIRKWQEKQKALIQK